MCNNACYSWPIHKQRKYTLFQDIDCSSNTGIHVCIQNSLFQDTDLYPLDTGIRACIQMMKNQDQKRRHTMISSRKKNIPHSLPPLQNHLVSRIDIQ